VIYNFAEFPNIKIVDDSYFSKKFLYLGGSARLKGFYTLVAALDHINKDILIYFCGSYETNSIYWHKSLAMIIVNKFWYLSKKQRAIRKIKQHKNAIFIGMIDNVDEYLQKVCCLISPFQSPHFSRPIMEAFLFKKSVITTNIEGIQEQVLDGINGKIVPVNNSKELAASINFCAMNPLIVKQYGKNGFNSTIEKFSIRNIDEFCSIYDSLKKQ